MAAERKASDASAQSNEPSPPKAAKGFAGLARRISRWTTNGVVTAMLLVMALVFGSEVKHMWYDGSARPAGNKPAEPATDAADSQLLAFGEQDLSIRRKEFAGRRAEVPAALLDWCRSSIADAQPRAETADAAERDVLQQLAAEKPAAEEPGQWRLYEWSKGFPITIGTKVAGTLRVPSANGTRSVPATLGPNLDQTPYRVVIWGIAVPVAANAWTLYAFQAGSAGLSEAQGASRVPLPPGGHRLATIRSAAGSSVTAFAADDDMGGSARRFYDRWFAEHNWVVAVPWQQVPGGWRARFEMPAPRPTTAVDIRLGRDPQGRFTGLLMESQIE